MIWIPGYEQKYNHGINPALTSALTREIRFKTAGAVKKGGAGYPQARYQSTMTPDIFVRARSQVYTPPQLPGSNPASNVVIDLANKRKSQTGG